MMDQKKIERAIEFFKHVQYDGNNAESVFACSEIVNTAISSLETVAKIPAVLKELKKQVRKMDKLRAEYPDDQLKRRFYLGMQDGYYDAIDLIKEKLYGEEKTMELNDEQEKIEKMIDLVTSDDYCAREMDIVGSDIGNALCFLTEVKSTNGSILAIQIIITIRTMLLALLLSNIKEKLCGGGE